MDDRRDTLLKEYGEVSSNFRLLTDIRFKLLARAGLAQGFGSPALQRALGQPGSVVLLASAVATVKTVGIGR